MTWITYTIITIAGALLLAVLAVLVALGLGLLGLASEDPRTGT
jgi:hypothetical protein